MTKTIGWCGNGLVEFPEQPEEPSSESAAWCSDQESVSEEVCSASEEGEVVDLARAIGEALVRKIGAGKGSFHRKGYLKKRVSKRDKTRQFWVENPDVEPWPLRPRLPNKTTITRRGN